MLTPRTLHGGRTFRDSLRREADVSTIDATCRTCGRKLEFRKAHAGENGRPRWCGTTLQIHTAPPRPPASPGAPALADEWAAVMYPSRDDAEDPAAAAAIQVNELDEDEENEGDD